MANELTELPRPADNPLQKPFWEAATEDRIAFMRCTRCQNAFLPAREECPKCLEADGLTWEIGSGEAKLVSWVVYHRPFNPAFADRVPYTVAVVELAEGPRLVSNIVGSRDPETLRIDEALVLRVEREGDLAIPRFAPKA